MAELVDAQVSGTCDRFGRGSSSLLQGTTKKSPIRGFFISASHNHIFPVSLENESTARLESVRG